MFINDLSDDNMIWNMFLLTEKAIHEHDLGHYVCKKNITN